MATRLEKAKKLQERTKKFAIRIVCAFARLKNDEAARVIGRQLLRSGTSVAANYHAACRARSTADFISKISIVLEEADETLFWLELLVEANLVRPATGTEIQKECLELVKIFSASLATAKTNR